MPGKATASGNEPARRPVIVIAISIGLVAITWVVFGQTLRFPFVSFDDPGYVTANRAVRAGLSLSGMGWAFTHVSNANWHPLTIISHMLDCTIFGQNAGGHHFTNVLLHSLAVLLLFGVLRNLTGATWRSAFVAALFAIHPLRVESVAWVAERKDILSGIFFFLIVGAYARYARSPSVLRYVVVALLFALGLLCKPMLVTVPFVLLLVDYWPLGRFSNKGPGLARLFLEKLPLLALSGLSSLATVLAQQETIAAMQRLTMSARIANALVAVAIYIRQMFLPIGLAVLYPHPNKNLPPWEVFSALTIVLAITAAAWMQRRKRPYGLTGWLWYLIMLLPVIGIVQVGLQAHADRYTYLPQIGLYILVTWLAVDLTSRWRSRRIILATLGGVVVVALAATAFVQTMYWRDSFVLWMHAAEVTKNNDTAEAALSALYLKEGDLANAISHAQTEVQIRPNSDEGHSRLGIALFREGRRAEALSEFRKVEQLRPNYPDVHYNLGTILLEENRLDEAIEEFRHEEQSPQEKVDPNDMRRDPGGEKYRDEALFRANFGAALSRRGKFDDALEQFRRVLASDPNYPKVHYNVGNIALQRGDLEQAITEFRKELEIQPNDSMTHADLGVALAQQGQSRDALDEWNKAVAAAPNNLNALCNLAWVLSTNKNASIRDGTKAAALARTAADLTNGDNPRVLRILAAAYAESGDFDKATETAERARDVAESQGNSDLAKTLEGNIESFKAHQPLRD
jgi:Flp pilus assembly protein TadD